MDPHKNPSLSEDLTVVLLRGNGSPRTFRFSLLALQRSLTALGFFFALAVVAALFLLALNIFRYAPDQAEVFTPNTESAPASSSPASTETGTGDSELRSEIVHLREDITRLNGIANNRKDLVAGVNPGLLQFFGPRNVLDANTPIQVKNLKVVRDNTTNIYVDFELHNVDPEQKPIRGYIVVLAKTPSFLMAYPDGALRTNQNIVLDFTKGETFGVSRFRQVRATFPSAQLDGKKANYEALLFSNDGKVIADLHVEDSQ